MKKLTIFGGKLALAAALLLGISSTASATLIDNFSTSQGILDVTNGETDWSTASGPGILGGHRDITISGAAADGDLDGFVPLATAQVSGGQLRVSNTSQISSVVTVAWDGAGYEGAAAGLGAAGDLSTAIAIVVSVTSIDQPLTIEFIMTEGLNTATASALVSTTGQIVFGLGSFVGDAINFASVDSIKMVIEGPAAYDVDIDIVETAVPEPSTMLLSGAALLALGLLRKRLGAKA
jgi:hypothetical protein